MYSTVAFAKPSKEAPFEKITIQRNACGDDDVEFDVKYCGICHADAHVALGDLVLGDSGTTRFPLVPGHELAGIVTKVGKNVNNFSIGDHVGVGCFVDSCLNCKYCKRGDEIGCKTHSTGTFNGDLKYGRISTDSGYTFGGYSDKMTIHKHFALKFPKEYPLAAAGPLLCAAITMYTPLKQWGATKGGKRVGIIGIGGLGQMGIRLAKAMGNTVTAISTSRGKEAMAMEMGATDFIVSSDPESMKAGEDSLDLILNTVSVEHQASQYLPLLARWGILVQLGGVLKPHTLSQLSLMMGNTAIAGSAAGSLGDTQECVDFCAKNNIICTTELVTWKQLQQVYENLNSGNDRGIRYVLDIEKSLSLD